MVTRFTGGLLRAVKHSDGEELCLQDFPDALGKLSNMEGFLNESLTTLC